MVGKSKLHLISCTKVPVRLDWLEFSLFSEKYIHVAVGLFVGLKRGVRGCLTNGWVSM